MDKKKPFADIFYHGGPSGESIFGAVRSRSAAVPQAATGWNWKDVTFMFADFLLERIHTEWRPVYIPPLQTAAVVWLKFLLLASFKRSKLIMLALI